MGYLIDTHFHLDYYKNHAEIFEKINELGQYTICMTSSPGVYYSCKKLYSESKYVKFALGFHPQMKSLGEVDFKEFEYLFNESKYIGEVGLDFSSQYYSYKEKQICFFERIIKKTATAQKVISVHLRNDDGKGIDILKKYRPKKCIIHWFTGTPKDLDELIKLDCYFSLNESMVRNNKADCLKKIPREKILIESDGPFTKVNGKKYIPDLLLSEYENIAAYLNEPDLLSLVYSNFSEILR